MLKLVETYVKKAEDLDGVNTNLIPGLLDAILGDYNRNVPAARDAEVLNVMATIISKLASLLSPQIRPILDAVFEPTLGMINQDFAEFPEHRVGFFKMLRAMNITCFPGASCLGDCRLPADASPFGIAACTVQADHGLDRLGVQAYDARYRRDRPE